MKHLCRSVLSSVIGISFLEALEFIAGPAVANSFAVIILCCCAGLLFVWDQQESRGSK